MLQQFVYHMDGTLEITNARSNPSILEQTRATLGAWDPHYMSKIRSCGSLQSGNDALLRAKQEPLDEGQADEKRLAMLQRKKEVG